MARQIAELVPVALAKAGQVGEFLVARVQVQASSSQLKGIEVYAGFRHSAWRRDERIANPSAVVEGQVPGTYPREVACLPWTIQRML